MSSDYHIWTDPDKRAWEFCMLLSQRKFSLHWRLVNIHMFHRVAIVAYSGSRNGLCVWMNIRDVEHPYSPTYTSPFNFYNYLSKTQKKSSPSLSHTHSHTNTIFPIHSSISASVNQIAKPTVNEGLGGQSPLGQYNYCYIMAVSHHTDLYMLQPYRKTKTPRGRIVFSSSYK